MTKTCFIKLNNAFFWYKLSFFSLLQLPCYHGQLEHDTGLFLPTKLMNFNLGLRRVTQNLGMQRHPKLKIYVFMFPLQYYYHCFYFT